MQCKSVNCEQFAMDANGNCNIFEQLKSAEARILEYEQTEASVCPEDFGIKEYVEHIQAKLQAAEEERDRLREEIKEIKDIYLGQIRVVARSRITHKEKVERMTILA